MIIEYRTITIGARISNASFSLGEGEFVMLTGEDSAAINDLIKSLYGAIAIHGEQAMVLDQSILEINQEELASLRKLIGIVLPFDALPLDLTMIQVLDTVLNAQDVIDTQERLAKISTILERLKLQEYQEVILADLCNEVKQLICIAAALIKEPKLLIASQPTVYLSEVNIDLVMRVIYDYAKNLSITSLIATHDLQLLQNYPSRILQVADQRVIDYPQ